jgi:oligopeptide/dipeptide ABC transporter ATP-binding protein
LPCTTNILEGIQLSRVYSRRSAHQLRAVHNVSLALQAGRTLALVGESGSGKTTLARMLIGLISPSAGNILLEGTPLAQIPRLARTRRLQMIFQDPSASLNPRLSVGTSVAEPLVAHRFADRSAIARRVAELFEQVGLDPASSRRFPHEFSGGQKQRIGIARAIALRPDVVIADEPTSALDVSIRVQILNLLSQIQQTLGTTFLLVSHDLGVVRHYSDQLAVIFAGKIVEQGPTQAVLTNPAHPYTRQLLDAVPSPSATRTLDPLSADAVLASPPPEVGCPFRHRCPRADIRCQQNEPMLQSIGPQEVACHFPINN